MTAAWIALAVIAVGLPLFAWWAGGRGSWARMEARGRAAGRAHSEMVARHGLTPAQAEDVRRAMTQGRQLDDPRLRAAAVDWAGAALAEMDRRPLGVLRGRSGTVGVGLGLAVLLVVAAILAVTSGDASVAQWLVLGLNGVNSTLLVLRPLLERRNLRRAVEVNSA